MNYLTVNRINDMNRILNQFHAGHSTPVQRGFKVDIAETRDEYRIYADLPGFTAENVDVRIEENLLIIEASVPGNSKEKEKMTWHIRERKMENLKRSFVLPEDVNRVDVDAGMNNGVLTVNLRKKPEAKPFTVKVQEK